MQDASLQAKPGGLCDGWPLVCWLPPQEGVWQTIRCLNVVVVHEVGGVLRCMPVLPWSPSGLH